ncbi:hypothetical protein [Candidatus Protochlamydia sp. W-9]|uniref:hypothetical protein n=1 Tax=Candidatus Protochlamydia sp. W-9 TaxID=1785087 RepID=UPI0013013AF5|nr:hypothetical protein [Candidatus Protochlamydia sp. W-9]
MKQKQIYIYIEWMRSLLFHRFNESVLNKERKIKIEFVGNNPEEWREPFLSMKVINSI